VLYIRCVDIIHCSLNIFSKRRREGTHREMRKYGNKVIETSGFLKYKTIMTYVSPLKCSYICIRDALICN